MWGALAALMLCMHVPSSQARLQPYYVVKGASLAELRPRVLFVLDTSGSMSWKSQVAAEQCRWAQCENGTGVEQSRIAAARGAIRSVVSSVGDAANFGLMTFEQHRAPTSTPPRCDDGNRFQWSSYYGYFVWDDVQEHSGYFGQWRLCDDESRPFPYLRWDELGVGSKIAANDLTGPVPASPLISTDIADMTSEVNAGRKVQWFPKFMGVRARLDDESDPDKSVLSATVGDYGDDDGARLSNVWQQDFYYWPYVDGFPGYSSFVGWPTDDYPEYLGVMGEDRNIEAASLYSPFYLDLEDSGIPDTDWGPADSTEALAAVSSAASPLIEGGVDAVGGTPWASAIGAISGVAPSSNAAFSHDSVASYLKFVTTQSSDLVCTPTSAVLITDGKPSPVSEGGAVLHERLAALRRELGVKVYVVGFFLSGSDLNDMACAAAGACDGSCSTPCDDLPEKDWDTCADPEDPQDNCAFLANSTAELVTVLEDIVTGEVELDIGAGTGERATDFGVGASGAVGQGETVQTLVSAYTEWPEWKGHVVREPCTAEDPDNPGELAPWCQDPGFESSSETFGPCPQSRQWDAGECLALMDWKARRIYTHDENNQPYRIANADGSATTQFRDELESLGLIGGGDLDAQADAVAAFILGKDWPENWKLPGLANSSPVLIRRIPPHQPAVVPSVSIRDPHCAGRRLAQGDDLPPSLVSFAQDAWDEEQWLEDPTPHNPYQEAVLVGDDLGVLHAFQYDSGNELWGLLPRALLESAVQQAANGAATRGQPEALEDHIYGVAATLNQAWIFDDRDDDSANHRWMHLGVFGLGAGGRSLMALDLSHMSPAAPDGPFEILWTSEDPANADFYDAHAGETWSRPSVVYEVPGNLVTATPSASLVFGSGYASGGDNGRTFVVADALTGEPKEYAEVTVPSNRYGDYGTIGDVAASSHCISRFWPEVQELYMADPAGQLFRWDLGGDHEADSGGQWDTTAVPVTQFLACEGTSSCTVGTSGNGDVFTMGVAVTANNRIDEPSGGFSGDMPPGEDQMLVALVSGSAADDDLNGPESQFHSSLYLLVDDHSGAPKSGGFNIPSGAPKMAPGQVGEEPGYLRMAFSDIDRTRNFTPYEGAPTYTETGKFSMRTRPVRAPRMEITGVVGEDGEVVEGLEVVRVTYTVYEPGVEECDSRWYDSSADVWYFDEGSVFEVTFRLTTLAGQGFDFTQGAAAGGDTTFEDSEFDPGLVMESVSQVSGGGCDDGNCGPQAPPKETQPCDLNAPGGAGTSAGGVVPIRNAEVSGFSPLE